MMMLCEVKFLPGTMKCKVRSGKGEDRKKGGMKWWKNLSVGKVKTKKI